MSQASTTPKIVAVRPRAFGTVAWAAFLVGIALLAIAAGRGSGAANEARVVGNPRIAITDSASAPVATAVAAAPRD